MKTFNLVEMVNSLLYREKKKVKPYTVYDTQKRHSKKVKSDSSLIRY